MVIWRQTKHTMSKIVASGVPAMLKGLPSICEYFSRVALDERHRGSGSVVIYHDFGDVINAAEYALNHYFPLTLKEPYLQNSSVGTPYEKWAMFTNEDFAALDVCLQRLLSDVFNQYCLSNVPKTAEETVTWASSKDAAHWFRTVHSEWKSCYIAKDKPELSFSCVNLDGWIEPKPVNFKRLWNRADFEERTTQLPTIIEKVGQDISSRATISTLAVEGLAQIEQLRKVHAQFAKGIRETMNIEIIVAPHGGTLSRHSL